MHRSIWWAGNALVVCSLALAVGCAAGTRGAEGVPAGTEDAYTVTEVSAMSMEIPGAGNITSVVTTTTEYRVRYSGRPDRLTVWVDQASIQLSGELAGEQDPPDLRALRGLEVGVTLNPRGEITALSGVEGNAGVANLGGVEVFRERLQELFLCRPEQGGLEVGRQWERVAQTPFSQLGIWGREEAQQHYAIEGEVPWQGQPALQVAARHRLTTRGQGDAMGTPLELSSQGIVSGTLQVEPGTGRILSSELRGTISGGLTAQGMTIPIDMRVTHTIRRR